MATPDKASLMEWIDSRILGSIASPYVDSESSNGQAEDADKAMATEALIEAKKEMLSGFRAVALQGGVFLGIIFGWTLTNQNAQRFLDSSAFNRVGAAFSVIFIGIALHIVLRGYRIRSQLASYRIQVIGKISSKTVDCYSIERYHILSTFVLFFVLCILLSYDVWQVEPPRGRDNVNVWIQESAEKTPPDSGTADGEAKQ